MKKIIYAAALLAGAANLAASHFRGADQVYVPAAGHLQGSSGTFITDAYIANLTNDEVKVSVIYQPIGANNPPAPGQPVGIELKDRITLAPNERREFPDLFNSGMGQPTGFGQLIFNGCKSGTSCGPETQNEDGVSPNFRAISVETRIYQIPNGAGANPPTTGQLFSGIPWYSFVSQLQSAVQLDKVFVTGITHTGNAGTAGTFRANLGAVNASQYSTTTIVFKLYQGRVHDADKKAEAQRVLGPLGNIQEGLAQLFPGVAFGSNYFVTVEQRNSVPTADAPSTCAQGCPAFLAYGSVLDNLTGDATTLEAQYLIEMSADALMTLYPGAGKPGIQRSVRH